MNRHERRRRRKMERASAFYRNYVQYLSQVPLDAPFESGKVHQVVMHHDQWCAFYDDKACNCNPIFTRHAEPMRS